MVYWSDLRNILHRWLISFLNDMCSKTSETVSDFINALFQLAQSCEFGNLKEELIRYRIVVGIKNRAVSEEMQLRKKLTLSEAVLLAKQAEIQTEQSKLI